MTSPTRRSVVELTKDQSVQTPIASAPASNSARTAPSISSSSAAAITSPATSVRSRIPTMSERGTIGGSLSVSIGFRFSSSVSPDQRP